MTEIVEMYTDGACRGNPGKGGWGVLLRYGGVDKTIYGGELMSTNNRMEMTAVIKGLEALTRASHVLITTDSKYVLKGMTEWLSNWKARNWRTASKKPVQNVELWKQLDVLVSQHSVEWSWVKGHSGHTENEIADQLANLGIDELIE